MTATGGDRNANDSDSGKGRGNSADDRGKGRGNSADSLAMEVRTRRTALRQLMKICSGELLANDWKDAEDRTEERGRPW